MAKVSINRITNANVYVDGDSFLGKVEEITLPDVKAVVAEHKALGLVGKMEFFSGLDKMEGKVKFNSLYSAVAKKFANMIDFLPIQVRANVQTITASGTINSAHVVHLMIQSKKYPGGMFKPQDNVEAESDFTVYAMKVIQDGETTLEVDVLNNTYKVGGVDMLAQYNKNLGV